MKISDQRRRIRSTIEVVVADETIRPRRVMLNDEDSRALLAISCGTAVIRNDSTAPGERMTSLVGQLLCTRLCSYKRQAFFRNPSSAFALPS
jgi:hypothetical protein